MTLVFALLHLAALICFGLATASFPNRFNLVALGLAFWVLVPLIHTFQQL
jgi:hypothetical protein